MCLAMASRALALRGIEWQPAAALHARRRRGFGDFPQREAPFYLFGQSPPRATWAVGLAERNTAVQSKGVHRI